MSAEEQYVCGYCLGDAVKDEIGWRHATAEQRIDPATISPGDFVSLGHNTTQRIPSYDLVVKLDKDEQFFYDNAGQDDPEDDRVETAKQLAEAMRYAERTRLEFQWWWAGEGEWSGSKEQNWTLNAGRMTAGPFDVMDVVNSIHGVNENPYTEGGRDWSATGQVIAAELALIIMQFEQQVEEARK